MTWCSVRTNSHIHQNDNILTTLDLLIDLDGAVVVTEVSLVDAGLSDHFVVLTDIHVQRPKAECSGIRSDTSERSILTTSQ